MGFHKRYIDNQQVIRLFNEGGSDRVIKWYTGKVDSLILETGLASDLNKILSDGEWTTFGQAKIAEEVTKRIHQELGIEEIKK